MPYVNQKTRREMALDNQFARVPYTAGELNYAITRIIHRYWIDFGAAGMFPGKIGGLVAPLVQQIVGGISTQLALFSGIVCAITVAGWIVLKRLQHQTTSVSVVSTDPPETKVPAGLLDKKELAAPQPEDKKS